MPPVRKQQPRRSAQASLVQAALAPEVIAKRTKRHLDELERSNYAEPSVSLVGINMDDNDEGGGGRSARGKAQARQTISDKKTYKGLKKKKANMNIRTAILYKKSFAAILEESGIASLPADVPTYLTAVAPPPKEPPRLLCTVCGYWGRYKCRRCGLSYCDKHCEDVHNETRCERRVI